MVGLYLILVGEGGGAFDVRTFIAADVKKAYTLNGILVVIFLRLKLKLNFVIIDALNSLNELLIVHHIRFFHYELSRGLFDRVRGG